VAIPAQQVIEPVVAEPVPAEPAVAEPVVAEPAVAEPVPVEPVAAELLGMEPPATAGSWTPLDTDATAPAAGSAPEPPPPVTGESVTAQSAGAGAAQVAPAVSELPVPPIGEPDPPAGGEPQPAAVPALAEPAVPQPAAVPALAEPAVPQPAAVPALAEPAVSQPAAVAASVVAADDAGSLADLDRRPVQPPSRTSAFLDEEQPAVAALPEPAVVLAQAPAPDQLATPQAPAFDAQAPDAVSAEAATGQPAQEAGPVIEPTTELSTEPIGKQIAEAPAEPATVTAILEPAAQDTPDTSAEQHTRAAADPTVADVPEPAAAAQATPAAPYDPATREAVHRVIRERRDIRNGFRPDAIAHDVLIRVLEAAHTAPSVGHSQPWDFVVIRSVATRERMHALAVKQREAYARSLPRARAKQFRELKIEAIRETPVNIVVTADPTRGGRHTLGRHTQPQMAPYSSALAVENLWLAARAEGLGVGWVSFFDEREMVRELGLPEHLEVVAYLCVGYVEEFPPDPELMRAGWSRRRPLSWVVHEEAYGRRALPGEDPHDLLAETLRGIRPLDAKALGEAWERQKRMTKPAGALGMLEIISAQLSGLSRQCPPPVPEPAAVAVFAGDHGVHAQGVTPWPQEVTAQMVANFLAGGAVINAFANQIGAEVCVIDVGVAAELPTTLGMLPRKVRHGTADFTTGAAMTREEAQQAIEVGIETARDLVAAGNRALITGEMGIANTTASAALIAAFTGADPAEVTGRGTGINDETHARKVEVVRRALELHRPDPADPMGTLAAIGGLEHAAMVGLILGGASLRTPVILDGVSAGAAALVARAIAPEALAACIAGHRSAEPGHTAALTKLGLRPLIDLDLRLGEGSGALLALPLVQSAARVLHEVATFDAAGVTE
jgi:nicotinate-nucleotide--dimethylbenzimidazole phosphoribosyltransferase